MGAVPGPEHFWTTTGGIRYLDIRLGWDNSTAQWVAFHYVVGPPVADILAEIAQFMQGYTEEIVVLELSHFTGYSTTEQLDELKQVVNGVLGEYLFPVDLSFEFTVNMMVESGRRILVTMEEVYDGVYIWPPESIYNTYADSPNSEEMEDFNYHTVGEYMHGEWPEVLFKISWTLTPDTFTVLDTLKPEKPHSLKELAQTATKGLPLFWQRIKHRHWKLGNIFIIDFYENYDIINVVLESNGIQIKE